MSPTPVRVGSELIAWSDALAEYARTHGAKYPLGVTECRWVAEVAHVLLCGSNDRDAMNPPLIRPSMFVEHKPGVVVSFDDPQYAYLMTRIAGFDLTKSDPERPDMIDFYTSLDKACAKDKTMCATPAEQAMRDLLERVWGDKQDMVLLTFATTSTIPETDVVSHEIIHAQYFTDPVYRQVIDDYWRALPAPKRKQIVAALSPPYNGKDELLMRNEFQAYTLMSSTTGDTRIGSLRDEHRKPLLDLLAAKGKAPIVVEARPPRPSGW